MVFFDKYVFGAISMVAISIGINGCAQDSMIRINPSSSLKLIPNAEIRYKACGDNADLCQHVFTNIANEKNKILAQAHAKYQQELENNQKEKKEKLENDLKTCKRSIAVVPMSKSEPSQLCIDGAIPQSSSDYKTMVVYRNYSSDLNMKDFSFNPTEENMKTIIKEVANNSLSEYTFSKSDGSIVVICPTRYCAISSADGGWIGIGERGKPNEINSVVK
jgi:hypothetical protein